MVSSIGREVKATEYPHIVHVPGVCGGQAIIEGTRIAVWHVVGYYYRLGMDVEAILMDWDYLQPAQIFSALAYYHDHQAEIDEVRRQNSFETWQAQHGKQFQHHASASSE